jgi:cytoskeletal protein RodZ
MLPTTQSISKDTKGPSTRTDTKQPNQTFLTHRNVVVLVVLLVMALVNLVVSFHLLPRYPYSSIAPESSTTVKPNIDVTAKEEPVNVSTTTTSPAITNGISTASTNGSVSTAAMTGLVRSSVITALTNDTINAVVNPSPSSPPRLKVDVYGGSITLGRGVANRYTSILGLEMPELEVSNRGKTKFTVPDTMLTQMIDDY